MENRSSRTMLYVILGGLAALFLCLCLVGAAGGGFYLLSGGEEPAAVNPSVEYILDVSSRMELPAPGGDVSRLEVARSVLADVVRPAESSTAAGLRVFGSGAESDSCRDTTLVVPVEPASQPRISDELGGLEIGPASQPALAEAMIAAIRDLSQVEGARSLVIVTGGRDLCSEEVGQLVARELESANIELRTFVIGFGVTAEDAQAIKEMVDEVEGGEYVDAPNADVLEAVLAVVQQVVDSGGGQPIAVQLAAGTPNAGPTLAASPTSASGEAADNGTPVATAEAGDDPVATDAPLATAVPTVDGFTRQTACDHPFFPLRQGATWSYSGSDIILNWTVVDVSGDMDSAEVTMDVDIGTELAINYHWTCSSDGIVSYDFGTFNMGAAAGVEGFSFEVVDGEGSFLPAGDMVPGTTWNNSYTIQISFSIEGQSITSSASTSQSFTAIGLETVTVAAGTFEAMRVESVGTITTEAVGTSFTSTSTSTYWFAEGVGMVKTESVSEGVSSSMELTSYSVPE
jgi:hypothetical protein